MLSRRRLQALVRQRVQNTNLLAYGRIETSQDFDAEKDDYAENHGIKNVGDASLKDTHNSNTEKIVTRSQKTTIPVVHAAAKQKMQQH